MRGKNGNEQMTRHDYVLKKKATTFGDVMADSIIRGITEGDVPILTYWDPSQDNCRDLIKVYKDPYVLATKEAKKYISMTYDQYELFKSYISSHIYSKGSALYEPDAADRKIIRKIVYDRIYKALAIFITLQIQVANSKIYEHNRKLLGANDYEPKAYVL